MNQGGLKKDPTVRSRSWLPLRPDQGLTSVIPLSDVRLHSQNPPPSTHFSTIYSSTGHKYPQDKSLKCLYENRPQSPLLKTTKRVSVNSSCLATHCVFFPPPLAVRVVYYFWTGDPKKKSVAQRRSESQLQDRLCITGLGHGVGGCAVT